MQPVLHRHLSRVLSNVPRIQIPAETSSRLWLLQSKLLPDLRQPNCKSIYRLYSSKASISPSVHNLRQIHLNMAEEQAKIKVHWLNGSRAQSILFLLELLEVPYELEIYHRDAKRLAPPELTKIHPLGKSPVVTVTPPGGGEPIVLAETAFIVQYLSEHFGNGKLIPKKWKDGQEGKVGGETEEWRQYQYVMYYAEGSFMSMMMMYYIFDGIRGPNIPFFIRPITRMVANNVFSILVIPTLKKHFGMLNGFVENGTYLAGGENPTGADAALAYPIVAIKTAGKTEEMAEWDNGTFPETYPKLWAYMDKVQQHPAWQRSVKKIEEIEGKFSILP